MPIHVNMVFSASGVQARPAGTLPLTVMAASLVPASPGGWEQVALRDISVAGAQWWWGVGLENKWEGGRRTTAHTSRRRYSHRTRWMPAIDRCPPGGS